LQLVALFLIGQKNHYHKNKFIHNTSSFFGFFAEKSNNLNKYLKLDEINEQLLLENSQLKKKIQAYKGLKLITTKPDFNFIPAEVIINNYLQQHNYITINSGLNDGVSQGMAVVSDKGIIGVVAAVSSDYAQVLTVLHRDFKVNAALKKNLHFGVLQWDGAHYNKVQLLDVPRLVDVKKGDTIVTGGSTVVFPKGLDVGVVDEIIIKPGDNYYNISVILFQDMSNLNYVYVVANPDKDAIEKLLNN
jgi:rod shape-determining protein MreC